MSVLTLDQLKPLLGLSLDDQSQDVALQLAVDAVEAQLQHLTRLRLAPVTLTEWYPGNWSRLLRLREGPVQSVTTVQRLVDAADGAWGLGDVSQLETVDPGVWYLKLDHTLLTTPPVTLSLSGTLVNRRGWEGAFERRRGRVLPRPIEGAGNYQITYVAGFPAGAIPAEFLPAIAAGVRYLLMTAPTGGLLATSESLDGLSLSFSQTATDGLQRLGDVQSLVARYRRPYIG